MTTHELTEAEEEMGSTKLMVKKIPDAMKNINKSLEEQDNFRELYTLDLAVKFKADMEKGLIQNRMTRTNKLSKLRNIFGTRLGAHI